MLGQSPGLATARRSVPAGAPAPVTGVPGDGGDPYFWLDASRGLYQDSGFTTPAVADTDPVGGVRDQSGHSHDAVQASATLRPLLKLAVQNGQPVLRFDGANDTLQAATVNVAQPDTIFVAAHRTTQGPFDFLFDGATARQALYYDEGNSIWSIYAGTNINGTAVGANAWAIFSILFNGAASQLWQNGTNTVTGNPGAAALTDLAINSAGSILGDIGDMLIYDRALTTPQRQAVEAYLGTKYSIVMA